MNKAEPMRYPLLEELLRLSGLTLQPTYSNRDLAKVFGVSVRAIQNRISSGQLIPRDLPGRAKFLSADLEQFLVGSLKVGR